MPRPIRHTNRMTAYMKMLSQSSLTVAIFILCIHSAYPAPIEDILTGESSENRNTVPWSTTSDDQNTNYQLTETTEKDRNEETNTSSGMLQYAQQMAKVLVNVLKHLENEKSMESLSKRMMSFMPGIIVPGSERYGRFRVNRGARRMSNDLLSAKIHALVSYYFDSVGHPLNNEYNKERHLFSRFTG